MTRFAEVWTARQAQLDGVFAETVRLVPMRAGGYAQPAADPNRIVQEIPAIIEERPERRRVVENAVGRDFDRALVVAETVASIDRSLIVDLPEVGDRLIAVDRPDTPAFEIVVIESDGLARLLLSLVKVVA